MDRNDIEKEAKINPNYAGRIEHKVAAVVSEKKCLPPASSRARNEKRARADAGNQYENESTIPTAALPPNSGKEWLRYVAGVKGTFSYHSGGEAREGNEGEGSDKIGGAGDGGEGSSGYEAGKGQVQKYLRVTRALIERGYYAWLVDAIQKCVEFKGTFIVFDCPSGSGKHKLESRS